MTPSLTSFWAAATACCRVAEVVGRDQPHLLSEHTARRIDVGHRHLGAALHLLADPGERPRVRACASNQHLRPRGAAKRDSERDDGYGDDAVHGCTPQTVVYANPVGDANPFREHRYPRLFQ